MEQKKTKKKSSLSESQKTADAKKKDEIAIANFGISYKQCCPLQREEVRLLIEQEENQ